MTVGFCVSITIKYSECEQRNLNYALVYLSEGSDFTHAQKMICLLGLKLVANDLHQQVHISVV